MYWTANSAYNISILHLLLSIITSGHSYMYTDTKCTGEMLELTCKIDHLIVVKTIYFGKSRTCKHGPWPPGCVTENHHFHPCTGLRLCTVKAPSMEIKGCGYNDYVHVEYDCLAVSSIEDICKADQTKTILKQSYGYMATPGYPTSLSMPHDTSNCIARIFTDNPENTNLNVYILDNLRLQMETTHAQCGIQLKFAESGSNTGSTNRGSSICLNKTFYRNDLLYSSQSGKLRLQFAVSTEIRHKVVKKGLLLYYEVATSTKRVEETTQVIRGVFPKYTKTEKQDTTRPTNDPELIAEIKPPSTIVNQGPKAKVENTTTLPSIPVHLNISIKEEGINNKTYKTKDTASGDHPQNLGMPIGVGTCVLLAAVLAGFGTYICYRRHQRKISFHNTTRMRHRIFSSSRNFSTNERRLPPSYDNPAFLTNKDMHLSERNLPEICTNHIHNESSLKLGENEEISVSNQYLSIQDNIDDTLGAYATIDDPVTKATKAVTKTAAPKAQLYAQPLPKRHTDVPKAVYVNASYMDELNSRLSDNTGKTSHGNRVNDWVTDQVQRTASHLSTIKEEINSLERSNHKMKSLNMRTFTPLVLAEDISVMNTHGVKQVDGELDSGFSDFGETIHVKSKPLESEHNKHNISAKNISKHDPKKTSVLSADKKRLYERKNTNEASKHIASSKCKQAPNRPEQDGPKNLKEFHVRKPSKRRYNNLQYAQIEHTRKNTENQNKPTSSVKPGSKPDTPTIYSSIDFQKSKQLQQNATHAETSSGKSSTSGKQITATGNRLAMRRKALSSSTESIESTASQCESEPPGSLSKETQESRAKNIYTKARIKDSAAISPIQKKRRSRNKTSMSKQKPEVVCNVTKASGNKGEDDDNTSEEIADPKDWTIQIQLKMPKNPAVVPTPIAFQNSNSQITKLPRSTKPRRPSQESSESSPEVVHKERPRDEAKKVSHDFKYGHNDQAKPSTKPKPRLAVAPKPILKYMGKAAELNLSDF